MIKLKKAQRGLLIEKVVDYDDKTPKWKIDLIQSKKLPSETLVANKGLGKPPKPLTDNMEPYWQKYNANVSTVLENKKSPLKADDFTKAAIKTYQTTGKIVPWDLAVAQGMIESQLGTTGRSKLTNPFNVYEYDAGTKKTFNSSYEGIQAYYDLIGKNYLSHKTVQELLSTTAVPSNAIYDTKKALFYNLQGARVNDIKFANPGSFTNKQGNRYATNPYYEEHVLNLMRKAQSMVSTPIKKHGGILLLAKLERKKNKILDGALHEEENKIKNKLGIKITSKGNPVVTNNCDDSGCELVQIAEVEKNELMLTKEATETIQKFRSSYKEAPSNEVLFSLGEYVTKQILNNTIDSKDKVLES